MAVSVRRIEEKDKAGWLLLWQGYLDFYAQTLPESVTEDLWRRILHRHEGFIAMIAENERGDPIGMVHAFPHQNTWRKEPVCYLEDLFVDPSYRGSGTGRALIEGIAASARDVGCAMVYWQTARDNETAQKLYDQMAERKNWVRYDMDL